MSKYMSSVRQVHAYAMWLKAKALQRMTRRICILVTALTFTKQEVCLHLQRLSISFVSGSGLRGCSQFTTGSRAGLSLREESSFRVVIRYDRLDGRK